MLLEELELLNQAKAAKQVDEPLDLSLPGSYYIDRIYHTHPVAALAGNTYCDLLVLSVFDTNNLCAGSAHSLTPSQDSSSTIAEDPSIVHSYSNTLRLHGLAGSALEIVKSDSWADWVVFNPWLEGIPAYNIGYIVIYHM